MLSQPCRGKKDKLMRNLDMETRTFHSQNTTGKFKLNVLCYKMFTFPLMLDVIFDIEVNSNISSYTGRPALPDVGLCDLHDGKGGDVLSHPGPAPEHHAAILWLPVQGDRRELDKRCGLLSSLKSAGFRAAHSTTAYLFTFAGTINKFRHQLT